MRRAVGPATAVALKVTAVRVPELAVSVFGPAVTPSVHDPTVATPDASVVTVAPVIVPPPPPTVNVTGAPANGSPFWSRTITEGAGVTAVPATPETVVEVFAAIVVAVAGSVFPSQFA